MDDKNIVDRINRAALNFLQPLSPQVTYETVVDEAVKLVNGKYGSLVLWEDGEFNRVYTTIPKPDLAPFRKKGYTWKAFKSQKAFVQSAAKGLPLRPHIKAMGIKSTLLIPLINKHESLGVLIVNSENDEDYNLKELSTLELFGSMASLAIRKTQLYDEAKKALDNRDLFISMASHELRTPLTTIMGYVQLLHSKLANKPTSEGRWVTQLYYESSRLNLLVSELLSINRIKEGNFQYQFKECSLKDIIGRVVSNFHFTHSDSQIDFKDLLKGSPDIVIGDFDKLIQVINNLIDNAAKFSPKSTGVSIHLLVRGANLVVKVIDYGKGIPAKDLKRIFEGFFRGDDQIEGLGLGLFLVERIVRAHNGSVSVKSKVGKGSTFEVILPSARH